MATPNFERPVTGPTYSDEHLDFWGAIYLANPQVRARGVLFNTFLVAPMQILRACATPGVRVTSCSLARHGYTKGDEAAVLTIAEATIRHLEWGGARCENGRWVEKLKHHAHPRGSNRDFQPRAD